MVKKPTYARGGDCDKAAVAEYIHAMIREPVDLDRARGQLGQASERRLVGGTRVFAELPPSDALKRSGPDVDRHIGRDSADVSAVVPVVVAEVNRRKGSGAPVTRWAVGGAHRAARVSNPPG